MRLIDLDIEIPKLKKKSQLLLNNGKQEESKILLSMIQFLENNSEIAFDYDDVYKKLEYKMWNNSSSYNSYVVGKFYAYEDSLETVKDGIKNE